jgi:hypothetical protein
MIAKYLDENFGIHLKLLPISTHDIDRLPLYLKGNFDLFHGSIINHTLTWAIVINEEVLTPDQLQRQGRQLEQYLNTPVVFILNQLESWKRKRLIEKHVSFVQPFKQLYIPDLLLQLDDITHNKSNFIPPGDKLTAPAQCAVLYHLQINSLEYKPFQEIARLLRYSAMTVSRIVKELEGFKLLTVIGTKEKSIKFNLQGKELWQNALPLLNSPIQEVWYTDQPLPDQHFLISGDTALATLTMLSKDQTNNFAIGKDEFRSMKTRESLEGLNKKNGDNRIEVWSYNPLLLSQHKEVDKLSLFLSLQYEEDERITGALQDLLEEMQW